MIGDALAGRHIVLTGATGFVGKVWLSMLLDRLPQIQRITIVVRRRSGRESALERIEQLIDTSPAFRPLRARHGAGLADALAGRLEVLAGDVERPLCGIDPQWVAVEGRSVDLVVHCAGVTDFQPDPLRALSVNVGGAMHAADLAARCGAPLVSVSTCFVAGTRGGNVPESVPMGVAPNGTALNAADEVRALRDACDAVEAARRAARRIEIGRERAEALGWPNIYTYSKGLAEQLLAGRTDVDVTIVRPSIIECARTYPLEGWNEGLNTSGPLAWLITTPFRRLPIGLDNCFDIVPVDDVARGLTLVAAAALRGEAADVYQLASGDVNPLALSRTVELTGLAMRRWIRKGGGTAAQRLVVRHLDPFPVTQDAQGPLAVSRVREATAVLRKRLRGLNGDLGAPADWALRKTKREVDKAYRHLRRVEGMLELYKPFIHDNDYEFRTDRVRALSDALPNGERDLAYGVPDIDWRSYWVDVEYPGLCTWCIPLIRGERVPADAPSIPPLRLRSLAEDQRAASK